MKTSCLFQCIHSTAALAAAVFTLGLGPSAHGAGILTPKGSPQEPLRIVDHDVKVTLNNGFARTEVSQTFFNPNPQDLEAVYRFPLPKSSSLSEVTLTLGEREIHGEVIEKTRAKSVYETEKQGGNDAGLATKETYQAYEFRVHPVRAGQQTRLRLVYYQPLEIDTGICRYLYPLEEGGTDDAAVNFWSPVNASVEGVFSAEVEVKSAWPVTNVRLPGYENDAVTEKLGDGHYKVRVERKNQALTKDLVVYYRLADDLPGRVEVIPYRAADKGPGTFMMVVTPGIDLQPLNHGADYVFVLDTSGSMSTKLQTLTDGVGRVLGKMSAQDRYRIVTFADQAKDLTGGWKEASPANVEETLRLIKSLRSNGSTNLYDGLSMAMKALDADRATSVVLVTDGVMNTGIVDPVEFHRLTRSHDIRIFGFLLGNSANWPIMRTVCETSGGFYAGVSNADDIMGQILQAKSKVLHECLHDAEFTINGVKTFNTTGQIPGKIYRGQQLVMFGQYEKGGEAELVLKARLTGEDKVYRTTFRFPETDTENPEIERLWALDQIEQMELQANTGAMPASESNAAVLDLGLKYQLVTDQTSMLVLSDDSFARHGIERQNQTRVALETTAQSARAATTPKNHRVDSAQPFTPNTAPSVSPPRNNSNSDSGSGGNGSGRSWLSGGGGGGGAISPVSFLAMAAFAVLAWMSGKKRVTG